MKRFKKKKKNDMAAISIEEACHRLAGFEDTMKNLLSLSKYSLSEEWIRMEPDRDMIYLGITERLCKACPRFRLCYGEEKEETFAAIHRMIDELAEDVQLCESAFGEEAASPIESPKRWQKQFQEKCLYYPTFCSEIAWLYQLGYQDFYWNNKIYELRKQMHRLMRTQQTYVAQIRQGLEQGRPSAQNKKMQRLFLKNGLRLLGCRESFPEEGVACVELWVRSCFLPVSDEKIGTILQEMYQQTFVLRRKRAWMKQLWIGKEPEHLCFVTAPAYHVLTGAVHGSKAGEIVCGDSFSFQMYEEQKAVVLLSDGMGTGDRAHADSRMLVETVEDLLEKGMDDLFVMELLHQTLLLRQKEVYSTLDLATISLHTGVLRLIKAGSAATFLKRKHCVERIAGRGLPLGGTAGQPFDVIYKKLQDGDMLIMVSDGALAFESVPELPFTMEQLIAETEGIQPERFVKNLMENIPFPEGVCEDDCTIVATVLHAKAPYTPY